MIVCLVVTLLATVPIVAFVGVLNPSAITQSPTLVSMNVTTWNTLYSNSFASFGTNTIIIVVAVAALMVLAVILVSKSIKKEDEKK